MDDISIAAYRESVARSLVRCFAAWSKMPPEEWATEIYRLPDGRRFSWEYAPYSLGMFRSLFDRQTIETSFEMYSRGLKSTVILLAIGYIIDQAPRRILSLWPTNSQAEKWSKDILCGELFNTTPCLNYLGSEAGKRIASNTLLHKLFPGGLIDMFGANAPGDMRRAKGSFLYAEEIDAIGQEVTDEGDQLAIFAKRGDEYPDTIRVCASYPSVKGLSRIDAKYQESDGNQWLSTCVRCGGEPFVMHRNMIEHEKDRPETARFKCPRCAEMLDDADRYAMAHRQGFDNWRPQREFRGRRGFHGNAMLWPHPVDLQKYPGGWLQCLAEAQIQAAKSENPPRALRVLVNTVDAEPFDPTDETEKPPEWRVLYNRRENYTQPPLDALVLTCFVDVQVNRLEIEWRAWGRDEQSWGLDHLVLDGNTKDPEIWKTKLCRELARKFKRVDGAEMTLDMGFVDGGWASEYVYGFMQWLAKHPVEGVTGKIRASKGIGQHGHPVIDPKWRTIAKALKGYHIGTWEAKDLINQRLRTTEIGPGYMHYPQTYGEMFFQQLCTGVCTIVFERAQEVRKFLNEDHFKDEGLDLAVGNLAAFRLRRWNFDAIELELAARAGQPVAAQEPEAMSIGRAGGWG